MGLCKKLKDYYSRKKYKSNNDNPVEPQAMTRGRLCQETASQKRIKAVKTNETASQNNKLESTIKTGDSARTPSNLDSEKTGQDLPDMSGKLQKTQVGWSCVKPTIHLGLFAFSYKKY